MSNTITDAEEVYRATYDARSKWRSIFFALDVSTATINSIGVAGNNDPDICYREGLSEWLKGGQRSWSDVVAALTTPTVGHEDLAKIVEQNHPVPNTESVAAKKDSEKAPEAGSNDDETKEPREENEVIEDNPCVPEVQLRPPLTLKWRKGKKQTPNKMSGPLQVVLIDGIVYVGGGFTGIFNDQDDCTVMKIDVEKDQCSKLPAYKAKWFGLTALDKQLVVVGGCDIEKRKPTNEIAVFDSGEWTAPFPRLNVPRQTPSAVSFNNCLIVVGGRDENDQHLSSVEILDVASKKWFFSQPLPNPRSQVKPVVINNFMYLFGGVDEKGSPVKTVNQVDLEKLILSSAADDTPRIWGVLKSTPFDFPAPLKFGKSLLVTGGRDGINSKPNIYLYMPESSKWVYVADLPSPRYSGAAVTLPDGEVILVGGQTSTSTSTFISILNFFSITKHY